MALPGEEAPAPAEAAATATPKAPAPAPAAAPVVPEPAPEAVEPEPTPEVAEPAPAEPEAPPEVSVAVTSTPPGAEVRRDGASIGKTPMMLKVAQSGDPFTLTLSIDGHEAREITVVPSEDRVLNEALAPIAKKTRSGAKKRPQPQRKRAPVSKKPTQKPAKKGKKRFDVLFDD